MKEEPAHTVKAGGLLVAAQLPYFTNQPEHIFRKGKIILCLPPVGTTMPYKSSSDEDTRSVTSRKSQLSHMSTHSSSVGGSDSAATLQDHISPTVGKREEANVVRARCLVAFILLLATAGVATAANLLVKQQERNDFENKASLAMLANQFFDALDSFASSIGAQAAAEHALLNTSWPFYTIPEWSVQAQKFAQLTGIENPVINVSPIVQEDEKDAWNSYAAKHNPIWYQESVENEGYTEHTAQELLQLTVPFIHFYDPENGLQPTPVSQPGEVYPLFQTYPIGLFLGLPLMLTNIDGRLASPQTSEIYQISKVTRRPTLGFTVDPNAETKLPASQIIQPIFDGANTGSKGRKMVASIVVRLPWMDYFKNVLAEGEDGIHVVIESSCPKQPDDIDLSERKQDFTDLDRYIVTYQVDGPNAVFLGEDDLHDPQYDDLVGREIFVDLDIDQSQLPEGSCVPVLTLRVYPSAELEDSLKTNNDIIYTVVVVVIFAFTTLVLLLYDFLVGRRQRTVMNRVVEQDRIVSDVFPTAIRDRLYENQAKQMMKGNDAEGDGGPLGLDENFYERSNTIASAPLADLFPSVTVVFADLVGFTAWSSAREPHHVFILLETIYGAFDKLAYRHSVFKIETVGDCYVSAAGLPEPTDDHAVVACRFARDCLRKMKDVTLKLEVALGPDTSELDLRTGIHR
eukprot:scaffold1417_cov113-Cylindrotheca_fusiformis.AAC.6